VTDRDESPGRRALRLQTQAKTSELGRAIASLLPPLHGFALFVFEFGADGAMSYISNGERASIASAIEEWLAKTQGHPVAEEARALRERLAASEAELASTRRAYASMRDGFTLADEERVALRAELARVREALPAIIHFARRWAEGDRNDSEALEEWIAGLAPAKDGTP